MAHTYCRNQEILIVDDTPAEIHQIAAILKCENFKIRATANPLEVISVMEASLPDIVLLDITMPEVSGIDLCKLIKGDERFCHIPVIFLTCITDDEVIAEAFNAGGQDYVFKPVKPKELLARMKIHLELKLKTSRLEEAYRDIENFNYLVCHDLKSPLWSINNLVSFLQDELSMVESNNTAKYLSGLREKVNEAVRLIDKLSDLSKISGNPIMIENVCFRDLFLEVFNDIMNEDKDRKISFILPEIPNIMCDKVLIRQVLYNVLSNSFKFTRHREVAKIEVLFSEKNNEYLFCIKDNGAGFDMKYSNRLFKTFQRLHARKDYEGTGAGLAITQKIIQKHGGRVWIDSLENTGTSFFFTLPVR